MEQRSKVYGFFYPLCAVCGHPATPPQKVLCHLDCGHLVCTLCLKDFLQDEQQCACALDGWKPVRCYDNPELHSKTEDFTHSLTSTDEDFNDCLSYFQNYVNYANVPCWNPQCCRTAGEVQCPYEHERKVLAAVPCPAGPGCWRGQWCRFSHAQELQKEEEKQPAHEPLHPDLMFFDEEPELEQPQLPRVEPPSPKVLRKQFTLQVRSKSMLYALMQDNMSRLKKAAGGEVQVWVRCFEPEVKTAVRWVFLLQGREQDFSESDAASLERAWSSRSPSCALADGLTAFLSYMIALPANSRGDFLPIARVGRLLSMRKTAEIDVTCLPEEFERLQLALQKEEIERTLGSEFPANTLLRAVRQYGIHVEGQGMVGTSEALSLARALLLDPLAAFGFPELTSDKCSELVAPETAKEVATNLGVLVTDGFVYGKIEALATFTALLQEHELSINCPHDIDELDVVILASKYQLVPREDKLFGLKENLVRFEGELQAIRETLAKQLKDAEVVREELPRAVSEEDVRELLPFFPEVRIEEDVIIGPREHVMDALAIIEHNTASKPFPTNLPYSTIEEIARKYKLELKNGNLKGAISAVNSALEELREQQVGPMDLQGTGFIYHKVAYWYPTQTDDFTVLELGAEDEEFKSVSRSFSRTLRFPIQRIEKIQNRRMYVTFAHKHEAWSASVSRSVKIMQLFHGTSETDPLVIARSEEGLDPRLGTGMWGRGSYYALKASYSHSFTHKMGDGRCQMFLCHVIVGDYISMPPQKLDRPPQNQATGRNYHSVQGHSAGSDIWITYETAQSYPSYLITYCAP